MKSMKKVLTSMLALVMAFALSIPAVAFAADEPADGTITVDNAVKGETYTIYRILELESYNAANKAYLYKATDAWSDFVNAQTGYLTVSEQGYVTWVKDASIAAFVQEAMNYVNSKGEDFANQGSKTAESTTVEFTGLDLGYYLLDSSMGTVCSIDTTNPDVVIQEKNEGTEITKNVIENNAPVTESDAAIGDTVDYQVTITKTAGAEGYALRDKMSDGLAFKADSVVVKIGNTPVAATNYSLTLGGADDEYTFEIGFNDAWISTLDNDTIITVSYSAKITPDAVEKDSVNNAATLKYGHQETVTSTTKTYIWGFDIFKYTGDLEDNPTALAGAKFTLSKGETALSFVETDEGYVYDPDSSSTELVSGADGKISIKGIDSGEYTLTETEAPAGYNKLQAPISVVLTPGVNAETGETTLTIAQDGNGTGTINVQNNTGAQLPGTGGIGTTIFYVVGGIIVAGAVIALVVRRRMAMNK